ncbi:peroxiredoxin-like family protein [uncultured Lutibacter sp.]|uniref:peroxiredoxin-like family protein n=1 Tax=uncultured Lutibacter sp. TaxID=437739 RepID=UPI00262E5099|nr:peroxiredoxin-like family protein [uncultured Lutibacter sp.]
MRIVLLSLFLVFTIGKATSQINNEHLKVGELAPKIVGIDQFNTEIDSDEILKENKILLLFYRGNWCPYCKKHLASLQENLEKLTEKGIYVIVVTPEKVEKTKETTTKFNSTFSIVHDINNKIMNDYKVAFEVNENNVTSYLDFTKNKIQEYNVKDNNVLPVPATYIINSDKTISYVHYNPNYCERSNFTEILNNL